ncbi:MAG: helix-turn-helix domain-containing protein, partial [Thermoguttaceae bacterium]|nr:helix-turn-helix domain-containing protein [Thermoguttaceae bacterium]
MRENQISNVPAAVQTSRLMTYAEVAEWTGCCVKTIRSYCKKGGLPCIQFGR